MFSKKLNVIAALSAKMASKVKGGSCASADYRKGGTTDAGSDNYKKGGTTDAGSDNYKDGKNG